MDTLTITLSAPRVIDGWLAAANLDGRSPEELATELLTQQGRRYADTFKLGLMTSAAFIARFLPAEYGAIIEAAATSPQVAALIDTLVASPIVVFDDPRLLPGLQLLVSEGLLESERVTELLAYERPTAGGEG